MADNDPWIATQNIYIGTALGYVPGDEVSDQVVSDHELEGAVARKSSQSAEKALAGEVSGQGLPVAQLDSAKGKPAKG